MSEMVESVETSGPSTEGAKVGTGGITQINANVPASYGEAVYKVPEKKGEVKAQAKSASFEAQAKGTGKETFAPTDTLLTPNGDRSMEYDEVTGEMYQAGESLEDYQFDFDENTQVDMELLDNFKRFAFENKMSVATAQKLAQFYDAQMQRGADKVQMVQRQYREVCHKDPEIGGPAFTENLRHARAGMQRYDHDGKLAHVLKTTGFGSHPEVVRFMVRIGKSLGEKSMVRGQPIKEEKTLAQMLYPSMKNK